jgi:hypothetical protein
MDSYNLLVDGLGLESGCAWAADFSWFVVLGPAFPTLSDRWVGLMYLCIDAMTER